MRLPSLLALAACFGGLTGVASKAVGSLLAFAVVGGSAAAAAVASSWLTWTFSLLLVGSVLFQLFYLNAALKEGAARVCVPMYQGLFLIAGLISGLVVWREDEGLSLPPAAACVGCGVLCVALGLLVVAQPAPLAPPAPRPPVPPRRCLSAPAALGGRVFGGDAGGEGAAAARPLACAAGVSLPEEAGGLRPRRGGAAKAGGGPGA